MESGQASAAVLIRPVSVAEIERTAREGLLMPPKSTFFTPKLKTGLGDSLAGGMRGVEPFLRAKASRGFASCSADRLLAMR